VPMDSGSALRASRNDDSDGVSIAAEKSKWHAKVI
jgi:hypothetical protein